MKKNYFADLSLIIVAIIWGSGFIATQIALDSGLHPFLVLFIRFLVATIILCLVFPKKLKKLTLKQLINGTVVGIFLFLGFATQTIGLLYTTPSNNAFLTATNVVMVPFISLLVYRVLPKKSSVLAALFTFVGIFVLTYKGTLALSVGDLLTLACALFFACHILSVGHFANKGDTYLLVIIQMLVATLLSLVFMLLFVKDSIVIKDHYDGLSATIYLGIFSTCIAFFVQNIAQRYTSSTKTAIFLSTESVFGTIFSVVLGYEVLTANMIIGGLIIFLVIIYAETGFKFFSKSKKKEDISISS